MIPVETAEWRAVPDFPGYEISSAGDMRSWHPRGFSAPPSEPRPMHPSPDEDGYRRVVLRVDGKRYPFKVAALVLMTFVGPRPEGLEACHGDGVKTNDQVGNLRWDTHASNMEDAKRHGTNARGERQGAAKLTEERVRAIRTRIAAGDTQGAIASDEGVSQLSISRINTRKTWAWLT